MTGEIVAAFPCFGGECSVRVTGEADGIGAAAAVAAANARLLEWHDRFTRFEPASELSRMNASPRDSVRVTPLLARVVAAGIDAAAASNGLVDPTLDDAIARAGYVADLRTSFPLEAALAAAPPRRAARPSADARWRGISVDLQAGIVRRPSGLQIDAGGIAKGLFADLLAAELADHPAFAIDCAGDVRVGGAAGVLRPVQVSGPFDGAIVHTQPLREGAAATSGIGRRSWRGPDGAPAHHLLDPSTGRPAFTGVVQATAFAPTGVEAERLAKVAVLSGPQAGRRALVHGGVLVLDDGSVRVVERAGARPRPGRPGRAAPLRAAEVLARSGSRSAA